jgi:hypothetical protein
MWRYRCLTNSAKDNILRTTIINVYGVIRSRKNITFTTQLPPSIVFFKKYIY